MTNEEIEAAREALESMINTAAGSGYATSADEQDAMVRLAALCAEVKRLKAEAVVMRELCENVEGRTRGPIERDWKEDNRRYHAALDAYRAMKGEKDAVPLSTDPLSGYTEPA